ncbi:hypothetical protein CDAR_249621 [Caerostris darwini]|uniref:Uncharacterized protein n=1 Tax=Caerostris darwini TaxID=1538125 RepID=A0AAV4RGC0_9ARAC|nr:hypothetical protein CDAR_249621 [Caerostris darwini]
MEKQPPSLIPQLPWQSFNWSENFIQVAHLSGRYLVTQSQYSVPVAKIPIHPPPHFFRKEMPGGVVLVNAKQNIRSKNTPDNVFPSLLQDIHCFCRRTCDTGSEMKFGREGRREESVCKKEKKEKKEEKSCI